MTKIECDHCKTVVKVNNSFNNPPDGWVEVLVRRDVGPNIVHDFCSAKCAIASMTEAVKEESIQ